MPTEIYFGKGQISHLGERMAQLSKKVLLVYGGGSIKRIGLYDQVIAQLKGAGIEYVELSGVEPNPRITSVRRGVELCREHGLTAVLAVGGAIACLRRGKVELEYSLDAHTIRLTERGRQVKSEELPLKDVNQLKRICDGMKLKCGRKQARIFCDKVTCERIESMVYAERA